MEYIQKTNERNLSKLSQLIDKYLIPQELEKKKNAEVSTPHALRQEMLDKIPVEFWATPKKVFEPCSGKGGFVIDIVDRFMVGLSNLITDEKERYRVIVEECLYFSDINPTNIYICSLLLDPRGEYKLNVNEGNTLELDIKSKWNIAGFDAVIGNPPYNDNSGNKGKGHSLWIEFVKKSLNMWLIPNGYLVYVHPAVWRQIEHPCLNMIKNKQLLYLEIHNVEDGQKIFRCATRYDWYILHNTQCNNSTIIKDESGKISNIDLREWSFIPNMLFDELNILINDINKLDVWRYRSLYGTENKKLVSKIKDDKFIYPLVYTINKKNVLSLRYTNNNTKGQFNMSKFIFSNGAGFYCDYDGKYGLTEWAYCIYDVNENLPFIERAFRSSKFNTIKNAIHLDSSSYNIKVMKLFKKDFWRDFI